MNKNSPKKSSILLLEDGTIFNGLAIGKSGSTIGEVCFNTGMTGYQEIFTDPSYYKQIMVATTIHIGNYGTNRNESESDSIKIAGLICRSFSESSSRAKSDLNTQEFLIKNNLVAITDIDTRCLIRHIRDKGSMKGIVSSEITDIRELTSMLNESPPMEGLELSSIVSTKQAYNCGNDNSKIKIAVLDLGIKKSIINNLVERGAYVKVFPAKTPFSEMEKWQPSAYFISNGPGDPASMDYGIDTARQILNSKKTYFGICLGHQLLALANNIKTYKMHNGHRGLNHPVKNLITNTCEITSQNHGFAIDINSTQDTGNIEITHINLNDKTIEGIRLKNQRAFSVQYHPEAAPGTHDSAYLFDDFMHLINQ
ncbi:MAG: glutamine-hydrolyzing carbamoyl-phosphate synthase small subunit [Solitalea-like symbiont of Acarus siro]